MNKVLSLGGYNLDESLGAWIRPGFQPIAYSDGDEIEQALLQIVSGARNLSSSSDELQSHCKDWVTSYHLSKQRANLLRPFEKQLSGAVLEVGAGCGALTRYLGEVAESVVAVEGSLRRAQIVEQRTRDLDNIQVVVDNFESFDLNQKFDAIVVVGVFEYADLFYDSDNPFVDFLGKLRKLVADDGFLLLGIENKLGLKYFAGAKEDHLGIPMIGVEGRYQDGGVRTFSKNELQLKMSEAGFSSQFFHSPVPDYKLPVGVITEKGILDQGFNSAALSGEAAMLDPQLPQRVNFNPLLAWHNLMGTALELEMSNSLLVEAHPRDVERSICFCLLAEHYGSARKSAFQKKKRFTREGDEVLVASAPMSGNDEAVTSEGISQTFQPEKYIKGETVKVRVLKRLLNARDPAQVLALWIPEWFEIIANHAHSEGLDWPAVIGPGALVDGRLLDAIPRNAMETDSGVFFFDQEWVLSEPFAIERLLFRCFSDLYGGMPVGWQQRWGLQGVLDIASGVTNMDFSDVQEHKDAEKWFQNVVTHPFFRRPSSDSLDVEVELNAAKTELDDLRNRLTMIEETKSWRWTKWFRDAF